MTSAWYWLEAVEPRLMLTGVADLAIAEHPVLDEVNPGGHAALEALIAPAMDAADEAATAVARARENVSSAIDHVESVVSEALEGVVHQHPKGRADVVHEHVHDELAHDGIHFVKDGANDIAQKVHEVVDEIHERVWMRRAEVLNALPPNAHDAVCQGLDKAGEVIENLRAEERIPEPVADKILDRFDSLCADSGDVHELDTEQPAQDPGGQDPAQAA